ncbi:hypothetical protein KFE25_007053 [Diacronema lutheri]|uniref:Kinesin light chain n=2 Tax=Diacronema lutheri TaxID=2081491 RepID=A0A8J5XS67_DIALT|nr:hypothetical protein KFE25_007053 [Diacronema lutheri]
MHAVLDADALSKALQHVLITVGSETAGVPEVLFTDTVANDAALDGAEPTPPGALDARALFVERDTFGAALERLKERALCTHHDGSIRALDPAQSLPAERLVSPDDERAILAVLLRVLDGRFVSEARWGAPGLKRLTPLAAPAEAVHKLPSLTWIERAGLCEALGTYLSEVRGDDRVAAFYLREALELKEAQLGADHEETGHALNQLGVCYKAMAMYDEAEQLLIRAAEVQARHGCTEAQIGVDHSIVCLLLQRGLHADAAKRIDGALEAAGKGLPADHPLVGALLLAHANLLTAQGHLEPVHALLTRALAILNGSAATAAVRRAAASSGPQLAPAPAGADGVERSAQVACAVQASGELALAEGRLVDGEKSLLSALAMFAEQCEQRHPRVLTAIVALAGALRAQARTHEAEELLRSALSSAEETRVGTHPILAAILAGLAAVCLDLGRTDEAEALLRRAANIATEVLGGAHPATAAVLHNLARAVEVGGKLDDAESLYRRALEADVASLGDEHAATARTLSNLGGVLRSRGLASEATSTFARAHAIFARRLGDAHPETARALANVGCALVDSGELSDAEGALRRALLVEEEALGPVHLETATTLVNLGACLAQQGQAKLDDAIRTLRRAAQIYRGTLGASHAQTRIALGWLKHAEAKRSTHS